MDALLQDIRDTFDLKKVRRRTSVLVLSAVGFTALSIRYPPVQPYVWLYLAFIAVATIHYQVTGKDILAYKAWELRRIWKPILAGVVMSVAFYVPLLLWSGWRAKGPWSEIMLPIFAWTVVVATVEEFGFRFVLLRTTAYGVVVGNVVFALLHPMVWDSLAQGNSAGFFYFVGYFAFGGLMTLAVVIYAKFNGNGIGAWFGIMWAITVHGAHNFFLTAFGPTGGATTSITPVAIDASLALVAIIPFIALVLLQKRRLKNVSTQKG